MNTLRKQTKIAILVAAVALGMMFGSTQKSEAAFYDNYYSEYSNNLSLWNTTHNNVYLKAAYANYYYYLAGLYGDYIGYYYDPEGNKSDQHLSSAYFSSYTYSDIYYNYYAYVGDTY